MKQTPNHSHSLLAFGLHARAPAGCTRATRSRHRHSCLKLDIQVIRLIRIRHDMTCVIGTCTGLEAMWLSCVYGRGTREVSSTAGYVFFYPSEGYERTDGRGRTKGKAPRAPCRPHGGGRNQGPGTRKGAFCALLRFAEFPIRYY